MKTLAKVLTVAFVLLPCILLSQWEWQNPNPKALHAVKGISAPDEDHVYIAEYYGNIIKSTDGGGTWDLHLDIAENITDIWFKDASHGWIVGGNGILLHTYDKAETWTEIQLDTINWLNDIFFYDDMHGWIVGANGTIYNTTNGGISWEFNVSGFDLRLKQCFFANPTTGYISIAYDSILLATSDGGLTWDSLTTPGSYSVEDFWFINADTGWISKYDSVYFTNDGGKSWSNVDIWIDNSNSHSIQFINSDTGWIITKDRTYLTTDQGESWNWTNSNFGADLYMFANFNTGWSITDNQIYKTSTNGTTWTKQSFSVSNKGILDIWFIDDQSGWAVGRDGLILRTYNGGDSWHLKSSITSSHLNDICFTDANNGWICGMDGTFLRTQNGGESWQLVNLSDNDLGTIQFINPDTGWLISGYNRFSGDGNIYQTTNGGDNWELQYSNEDYQFTSIYMLNKNTGWIGCYGGLLMKTTDGGETWEEICMHEEFWPFCYGIQFINDSIGFTVGGYNRMVFRTQDGGKTWHDFPTYPYLDIYQITDIFFMNELQGWIVGYTDSFEGFILYTEDGAENWKKQKCGAGTLNSIFHLDVNNMWVSGYDGSILFTNNMGGSASIVEKILSKDIIELAVLPNPCYSNITLEYTMGTPGIAWATIYNHLGQQKGTIASQYQQRGTQQLNLNVSHLSPGVYICCLYVYNRIITKKFIKL